MELIVTYKRGVILLFLLLCTFTNKVVSQFPCTINEELCGCVFKNEKHEWMIISLLGLNNKDGHSYYFKKYTGSTRSFNYYLNLCTQTTSKSVGVGCKNVTDPTEKHFGDGCQVSTDLKLFYTIANSGPKSFGLYTPGLGKKLEVTYGIVEKRQMFVTLTNTDVKAVITGIDDSKSNIYRVAIDTAIVPRPFPPPSGKTSSSGLSTGSIIVIVFFCILLIYCIAGILFMKYKRGATGKEVIPNVQFWSSLPGLVKDGCVFFGGKMKELCQKCCQRDGYNEI